MVNFQITNARDEMKTYNAIQKILFLLLVLLYQTSCSKETPKEVDPIIVPVDKGPVAGKWIYSSSKYYFPGNATTGRSPDTHFTDTTSINFLDASTYAYTWVYKVIIDYQPQVPQVPKWAKVWGSYEITQDTVLNILPKKTGIITSVYTENIPLATNRFYNLLCEPFPNLATDTTNYVSSFKLINQDRLVIVTYYPEGATSKNFTAYDSVFFNRKK
jgi:hypothetical protein